MKRPNYLEQIKENISKAEPGTIFIPSDFFHIAEAVKVNVCLNRITENGLLNRIMRGVYAKPRYSELLKKNIPPHSDSIARAIARNYGWTVIPCGDTALNILGLSTQVPAIWLYVSDGPYKTYIADGITFQFKHTDNKNEIIAVSYQTALIVQALRALGKGNITDREIIKLSTVLGECEKKKMLTESQRVTSWIYGYIKIICMEAFHE